MGAGAGGDRSEYDPVESALSGVGDHMRGSALGGVGETAEYETFQAKFYACGETAEGKLKNRGVL